MYRNVQLFPQKCCTSQKFNKNKYEVKHLLSMPRKEKNNNSNLPIINKVL